MSDTPPSTAPDKLRIAIVSTPRSGNTWIRHLIAGAYNLPTMSRHGLADDEWDALPEECALQIHWRREPDFVARLERHGFRVVTVARHPLDTLISILHVVVYDVESENWLLGRKGDESSLWGAWPRSRAFLDYCAGPRAAELLAVSCDWWDRAGVVSVKYEDFVRDAAGELAKLVPHLGPPRCESVDAVLERTSLSAMRKTSTNNHFWMGRPGLWRTLLPAGEACRIGWAVKGVFDALGYELDPDPDLDARAADRNWLSLVGPELGRTLRKNTEGHRTQIQEAWTAVKRSHAEADEARRERDEAWAEVARRAAETNEARAEAERRAAETDTVRREKDELTAELADRQAELGATMARLTGTDAKLAETEARLAESRTELGATAARLTDAEAALVKTRGDLAAAEAWLAAAAADSVVHRHELAEALAKLAEAATLRDNLAAVQTDLAVCQAALSDATSDARTTRAERDAVRAELAAAQAEADRLAAELRETADRLAVASREWAAAQHAVMVTRATVIELRQAAAAAWVDLTEVRGALADCRAEREAARHDAAAQRDQAAALAAELVRYRGLQGLSVRLAWRLQRLRNRFPWFAGAVKRVVTWKK